MTVETPDLLLLLLVEGRVHWYVGLALAATANT
jgi:hypothetical protein